MPTAGVHVMLTAGAAGMCITSVFAAGMAFTVVVVMRAGRVIIVCK